jgi:hypothetical protein
VRNYSDDISSLSPRKGPAVLTGMSNFQTTDTSYAVHIGQQTCKREEACVGKEKLYFKFRSYVCAAGWHNLPCGRYLPLSFTLKKCTLDLDGVLETQNVMQLYDKMRRAPTNSKQARHSYQASYQSASIGRKAIRSASVRGLGVISPLAVSRVHRR